jgi:hypothetical protein
MPDDVRPVMPTTSLATTPPAPQTLTRRLVVKRNRNLTCGTAIFYLQTKSEVDAEYRRVVELLLEHLVKTTGVGGHELPGLEVIEEASTES